MSCNFLFYVRILSSVLFTTGCKNMMSKSLIPCNSLTAFCGAVIQQMKIEVRRINPCPSANLSLIVIETSLISAIWPNTHMAIRPNTHTNIDSLHIRQTLKILLRIAQSEGGTGEQGCGEESISGIHPNCNLNALIR